MLRSTYLAIEFRYWTRVLRWLGRRGQRWTSRRWKLVRILRASTWPVILGRVARLPVATFWRPIIAHRPSHFWLVRHTVARIQPSCRRQRDFGCWTAKISTPKLGWRAISKRILLSRYLNFNHYRHWTNRDINLERRTLEKLFCHQIFSRTHLPRIRVSF